MRLRLRPAPAEHGIRFVRTDVGVEIPATLAHIGAQDHATTLQKDGVSIGTVEHLLAALLGLGVDDALVEVDGPEVPVLDGSAAPFVILLHEAGLRPLAAPRLHLKVLPPGRGGARRRRRARLAARRRTSRSATRSASTTRCCATRRSRSALTPRAFTDQIAPARTFGFLREVELLRKNGLALGGSLENAVVIGETGVLNNKLRFEDEFVRHKVLDAVGDLALLGHPLVGRLEATKAGHALHAAVARKLVATPDAWELVPAGAVAFEPAAAAAPALQTRRGVGPARRGSRALVRASGRALLRLRRTAVPPSPARAISRSGVFASFERTRTFRSNAPAVVARLQRDGERASTGRGRAASLRPRPRCSRRSSRRPRSRGRASPRFRSVNSLRSVRPGSARPKSNAWGSTRRRGPSSAGAETAAAPARSAIAARARNARLTARSPPRGRFGLFFAAVSLRA